MKVADSIALPTAQEIETILPKIKETLAELGIGRAEFYRPAKGGLLIETHLNAEQWHKAENDLFAHGIVMVAISPAMIAFAVRR